MKKSLSYHTSIFTPEFRVSFAYVFEPFQKEGQTPAWAITMIFEPEVVTDPKFQTLETAIKDLAEEFWGKMPSKVKLPLKKGTPENYELEKYPEYEGKIIAVARNKQQPPGILDARTNERLVNRQQFYSGCYAIASVRPFCGHHPTGGAYISLGLGNLMKTRDGVPLGFHQNTPEDEFQSIRSEYEAVVNNSNSSLLDL